VGHGLLDRILRNNPDASGSFDLLHHDFSIVSYNQHSIENVPIERQTSFVRPDLGKAALTTVVDRLEIFGLEKRVKVTKLIF